MLKINSKIENLRKKIYKAEKSQLLNHILYLFYLHQFKSHFRKYFLAFQYGVLFSLGMTKIRSVCLLTGRSRSVYRNFKVSRLKLKEYTSLGYFVGLSKKS